MSETETVELPEVPKEELDAFLPPPETLTLSTGVMVRFEDLKSRQFFKLLRIITHGAAHLLGNPSLFVLEGDSAALAKRLFAMVMMAVPDAEDETIDFVRSMVRPEGLIDRGRRGDYSKSDKIRNEELEDALDAALDNPELEDLIDVIEGVFRREADDLAALGKRLGKMMSLAQKTGQLTPSSTTSTSSPTSPASTSSEGSPEPSTSSPVSTDGATTPSKSSPSEGFVSVSQL
jgi:hypothetical protein